MLFNVYLEHIMLEMLDDYNTSISFDEWPLCNLLSTDDIDLTAGIELIL